MSWSLYVHWHIIGEKSFEAPPAILSMRCTGTSPDVEGRPKVVTEETHLRTARMMKEARVMADDKNLKGAQDKLVEAQNSLEDVIEENNPMVEMLKSEVQQLLKLIRSQEIYKQGHPFALSYETSHYRQRFAAKGNLDSLRLFLTPLYGKVP